MRDPNRLDEVYEKLHKIHKESFPDLRTFQFFENFISWVYSETKSEPFYFEDDKFLVLLERYYNAVKVV